MTAAKRQIILGGAKSGKSNHAETLVAAACHKGSRAATYIATAQAGDAEMARRIERHRQQRDRHTDLIWQTVEVDQNLGEILAARNAAEVVLIDCLTLWLSNCLSAQSWPHQKLAFLHALEHCPAEIFMVSNEVSMGVVPIGELTREFVDEIGLLHQELGRRCDSVTLMVAGFATQLK